MPSADNADEVATPLFIAQQFWVSGTLRCVLALTNHPVVFYLQILSEKKVIYAQPVADADEAAQIAETLWKMFVEKPA